MTEIKSGEQISKEFFDNISSIPNVDQKLAAHLKQLYEERKFTDTNIKNMLDKLIEEEMKNET